MRGQGGLHAHRACRGVAQREAGIEAVATPCQRRQPRQHLQILRHAHAGAAGAEAIGAGIGDGDEAKAGERIVQRHVDLRLAARIQHDGAAPQQQRVEELARRVAAAAAAGRQRLAAVVAPADDFALRGGRLHTPGPHLQQAVQQVPGLVGAQRQQAFVDRRKGDLGARRRLATLADLDGGAHRLAHAVLRLGRAHLHVQLVLGAADGELRHAELEGRLGKVDHRRGRAPVAALVAEGLPPLRGLAPAPGEDRPPGRVAQAATQHQRGDGDVGCPGCMGRTGARYRQLDHRLAPAERDHARVDHAFALHRHQRGGLAEGHAHLQARGLARLDLALLGQQVDAVVVVLREPPLAAIGQTAEPGRRRGAAGVAEVVDGAGHQFDLAADIELGAA